MKEGTKATEPDRRLAQAVASTKCVLLKFERTPRRGGALFFLEARIVAGDAPVPWGAAPRRASHSFCVGKVPTIIHRASGAAVSAWKA